MADFVVSQPCYPPQSFKVDSSFARAYLEKICAPFNPQDSEHRIAGEHDATCDNQMIRYAQIPFGDPPLAIKRSGIKQSTAYIYCFVWSEQLPSLGFALSSFGDLKRLRLARWIFSILCPCVYLNHHTPYWFCELLSNPFPLGYRAHRYLTLLAPIKHGLWGINIGEKASLKLRTTVGRLILTG
jgi:hypothetical protein